MSDLSQISAHVSGIRSAVTECIDILDLRDEYRHAFAAWARAVGNAKRWIADEAKAMDLRPEMVLTIRRQSVRYQQLQKVANVLHALMVEARERCAAAGDDDWATEQESREFDVENEEAKA